MNANLSFLDDNLVSLFIEQDNIPFFNLEFVSNGFDKLHPKIVCDLAAAEKFHAITDLGECVDNYIYFFDYLGENDSCVVD